MNEKRANANGKRCFRKVRTRSFQRKTSLSLSLSLFFFFPSSSLACCSSFWILQQTPRPFERSLKRHTHTERERERERERDETRRTSCAVFHAAASLSYEWFKREGFPKKKKRSSCFGGGFGLKNGGKTRKKRRKRKEKRARSSLLFVFRHLPFWRPFTPSSLRSTASLAAPWFLNFLLLSLLSLSLFFFSLFFSLLFISSDQIEFH